MDEWKIESVLPLQAARRTKLSLAVVDPYDAGAASRQPRGNVCGTTSQLDYIFAGKFLGENSDLRLGDIPDTLGRLLACPGAFTSFHVLRRKIIPVRSISGYVLRHLTHRNSKVFTLNQQH